MRRVFTLGLGLLLASMVTSVALADEPPPPRLESAWDPKVFTWHNVPWAGLAPGSMKRMRASMTTTMKGQAPQSRVMDRRETLIEVTDTHYIVRVEHQEGTSWRAEPDRKIERPLSDRPILEILGPGEVTINGEKLTCTWQRMMRINGGDVVESYDVCSHKEHGVVDVMQTHPYRALSSVDTLYVKHRLGEQVLNCRRYILKKLGKTGQSRSLMCLEVPGMMTSVEERFEIEGGTRTIRDELVAFKRIPRGDGFSP
jgi:hypothetical protein